jgi:hypothetical protein
MPISQAFKRDQAMMAKNGKKSIDGQSIQTNGRNPNSNLKHSRSLFNKLHNNNILERKILMKSPNFEGRRLNLIDQPSFMSKTFAGKSVNHFQHEMDHQQNSDMIYRGRQIKQPS